LWVACVKRNGRDAGLNTVALLIAIVLSVSLLQALLEKGGAGRFCLPTQSLAMSAVVIFLFLVLQSYAQRRERISGDRSGV
jgi:hypothetical protein